MMIYLAHPIDRVDRDAPVNLAVSKFAEGLAAAGHVVFDPAKPYQANRDGIQNAANCRRIEQINDAAIDVANILVAVLDATTPSVGVPVEMWRALNAGKTVVVAWVGSYESIGVMLRSWVASDIGLYVETTFEGVLDVVEKTSLGLK